VSVRPYRETGMRGFGLYSCGGLFVYHSHSMKNPIYEPPKFNTNKALLFGHVPFAISLNDSSTLSGSKDEIRKKIKDQIMVLANSYVSLATFVTPEELQLINSVRESLNHSDSVNKEDHDKALAIYNRVLNEIETFKDEVSKIDFI
jgi:hypothetical protein